MNNEMRMTYLLMRLECALWVFGQKISEIVSRSLGIFVEHKENTP